MSEGRTTPFSGREISFFEDFWPRFWPRFGGVRPLFLAALEGSLEGRPQKPAAKNVLENARETCGGVGLQNRLEIQVEERPAKQALGRLSLFFWGGPCPLSA